MKYYLIAGEASGDLHASNLMLALRREDPAAEFRCWGGDRMAAAGGEVVKHYRDLAFMGFWEVAKNLRTIFSNLKFCKEDIAAYKPDAVILIDYPGFNLRMAQWAKRKNYQVHYYISPQIWAWKESRIKNIKRYIDFMYVILPFEKGFYEDKHRYPVDFVGHPLLDAIEGWKGAGKAEFLSKNNLDDRPLIALLPGSRTQEIRKMLREMAAVSEFFPHHRFVVAGIEDKKEIYEPFAHGAVKIIFGQTYDLLSHAEAALVTSGTATLEAALFEVPEVVCYKGGAISYFIAKRLVSARFISLVNLIMDREVVKELIQKEMNVDNLRAELDKLLAEEPRARLMDAYQDLKQRLGGSGASAKTAKLIFERTASGTEHR